MTSCSSAQIKQRRDEAAVLADRQQLRVGGPGEDDVLGDAVDLGLVPLATEEERVDLGLPGAESRAGPGAERAALLAVGAVVRPAHLGDVERAVDAVRCRRSRARRRGRRRCRRSSRCRDRKSRPPGRDETSAASREAWTAMVPRAESSGHRPCCPGCRVDLFPSIRSIPFIRSAVPVGAAGLRGRDVARESLEVEYEAVGRTWARSAGRTW